MTQSLKSFQNLQQFTDITQFLGLAEESNLIFPIGDMVVNEICSTISKWVEEGYEVPPIAVNIAARQFMQKRLGLISSAPLTNGNLSLAYSNSKLLRTPL